MLSTPVGVGFKSTIMTSIDHEITFVNREYAPIYRYEMPNYIPSLPDGSYTFRLNNNEYYQRVIIHNNKWYSIHKQDGYWRYATAVGALYTQLNNLYISFSYVPMKEVHLIVTQWDGGSKALSKFYRKDYE